jgi:hypothetical protein
MDRKSILTALAFLLFSLGSLWGQTPASQGDKTVRGRITDEAGEPLIGAAVVNKTNGKGVEAGADGTYSIVIRGRTLLEFSFIGMETVQATFDGAKDAVFNVRMKSSNALNEAVVSAGYGVIQKRENFAGSAFEIKGEDLKVRAHDRLDNMLAGMVPGMQVTESSVNGARTSISIRIRGRQEILLYQPQGNLRITLLRPYIISRHLFHHCNRLVKILLSEFSKQFVKFAALYTHLTQMGCVTLYIHVRTRLNKYGHLRIIGKHHHQGSFMVYLRTVLKSSAVHRYSVNAINGSVGAVHIKRGLVHMQHPAFDAHLISSP